MQILVSGSLAYDRIMDFPGYFKDHILPEKVHLLNVSFEVKVLTENFGGTAGNIAYNLKLLGENPIIISTAGKDFDRYSTFPKLTESPQGPPFWRRFSPDLEDNRDSKFQLKFPIEFQLQKLRRAVLLK